VTYKRSILRGLCPPSPSPLWDEGRGEGPIAENISLQRFWNFNEVPGHSPALARFGIGTTLGFAAEIPNPEWVVARSVGSQSNPSLCHSEQSFSRPSRSSRSSRLMTLPNSALSTQDSELNLGRATTSPARRLPLPQGEGRGEGPNWRAPITPKAFYHLAQGCEERATLGPTHYSAYYSERVESNLSFGFGHSFVICAFDICHSPSRDCAFQIPHSAFRNLHFAPVISRGFCPPARRNEGAYFASATETQQSPLAKDAEIV
jgi:hypothetical protein